MQRNQPNFGQLLQCRTKCYIVRQLHYFIYRSSRKSEYHDLISFVKISVLCPNISLPSLPLLPVNTTDHRDAGPDLEYFFAILDPDLIVLIQFHCIFLKNMFIYQTQCLFCYIELGYMYMVNYSLLHICIYR